MGISDGIKVTMIVIDKVMMNRDYLWAFFLNIFDKHPRHFYMGSPPSLSAYLQSTTVQCIMSLNIFAYLLNHQVGM